MSIFENPKFINYSDDAMNDTPKESLSVKTRKFEEWMVRKGRTKINIKDFKSKAS